MSRGLIGGIANRIRVEKIVPVARERLVTVRDDAPLVEAANFSIAETSSCRCLRQGRRHGAHHYQNKCRSSDGSCLGCGCTAAAGMVMIEDVTFCRPDELLHDVWSLMKERKLVHVPIVGDDLKPLGVINARDALLVLLEGSEYEEGLLRDYVMGIGYW